MEGPITRSVGAGTLELAVRDITAVEVDAIVNAANSALQLGGGVAGAIRLAGGPEIQTECDQIGSCPVGGAVVTGAGYLPARFVIHAVGPVWGNNSPEECDRLLASACREAIGRAHEKGVSSVALPSLSTGVFGFPVERAAPLLLREAILHLQSQTSVQRILFCLAAEDVLAAYDEALRALLDS